MSEMTPQEIFQRYISAGLARDAGAQADLFAADGVLEAPLTPPGSGYPRRVEGRGRIRDFLTALHQRPPDPAAVDVAGSRYHLHLTEDPLVFIAEIDVVFANPAARGPMSLVQIYRLRGSEIASLRDYYAPGAVGPQAHPSEATGRRGAAPRGGPV